MRHRVKTKKLGRTKAHRDAMLRNLIQALFLHERIQTTLPKAREAGRLAERMVTHSLKNTVAARREVARFIPDRDLIKKLFDVIGPRFTDRQGGYTRIYKLGPREGDGAEMVLLELVVREQTHKETRDRAKADKSGATKAKAKAKAATKVKAKPKAAAKPKTADKISDKGRGSKNK